jgi:hypothetical protein
MEKLRINRIYMEEYGREEGRIVTTEMSVQVDSDAFWQEGREFRYARRRKIGATSMRSYRSVEKKGQAGKRFLRINDPLTIVSKETVRKSLEMESKTNRHVLDVGQSHYHRSKINEAGFSLDGIPESNPLHIKSSEYIKYLLKKQKNIENRQIYKIPSIIDPLTNFSSKHRPQVLKTIPKEYKKYPVISRGLIKKQSDSYSKFAGLAISNTKLKYLM